MYRYAVKRILLTVPTLLGAAVLVFLLMRAVPGDVCLLRLGGTGAFVDEVQLAACRQRLGLDDPLWLQFLAFMRGVLTFDFGTSMWSGQPVAAEIGLRFQLSL
ncbi:MAG: ABC transporter permease, partial [Alphaproteobacteria bacterium]